MTVNTYFPLSLVAPQQRWSFQAGSTSLSQFQFVGFSGGQLVNPASGAFAVVLDDAPAIVGSGATISNDEWSGGYTVGANYGVVTGGIIKVQVGATLTQGQAVMTNASGQAIGASGTGNWTLGVSLGTANNGDFAAILWAPSLHY